MLLEPQILVIRLSPLDLVIVLTGSASLASHHLEHGLTEPILLGGRMEVFLRLILITPRCINRPHRGAANAFGTGIPSRYQVKLQNLAPSQSDRLQVVVSCDFSKNSSFFYESLKGNCLLK